jgi:predicted RNA-binding protein with PIN domain
MPLLIDGHNLIGQLPDLSLSDPRDEVKLVARLQAYAARSGRRITVVFDPGPQAVPPALQRRSRHGYVEVIYADPGQKADDVIRSISSARRATARVCWSSRPTARWPTSRASAVCAWSPPRIRQGAD